MERTVVSWHDSSTSENRYAPAPWRDAMLAGLPHALVALTYQAALVATAYGLLALGTSAITVMVSAPLAVSTLGATVIAWRRRWPVLGRRDGKMGRLGLGISLTGMMLLLATDVTASWWYGRGSGFISLIWSREATGAMCVIAPASLAVLLCVAGAALLGRELGRLDLLIDERALLIGTLVLILVPVIAALPLVAGLWNLRTVLRFWAYVLGVPWLALAIWLISRRDSGCISEAAA